MPSAKSEAFPSRTSLLVGRILLYADEFVASWIEQQTGDRFNPPYTAFGIVDPDGQMSGAVIFSAASEADVEMSIVAPKRLSRGVMRVIARYAFDTAGFNRITVRTRASSLRVRGCIEKAGFRQEGVLRSYYRDGDDAIIYGLLVSECRWL